MDKWMTIPDMGYAIANRYNDKGHSLGQMQTRRVVLNC